MNDQPSIFEQGMSENDRRILRAIMGRTRSNPITIREIQALTGLSNRVVRDCVSRLNTEHRMPIGSSKSANGGYFWCSTRIDRIAAARVIIKQMRSEGVRVRALLDRADLAELEGQERLLADVLFQGLVA